MKGKNIKNPAPVSVVIPCYECAQTIERALHSVVMQTYWPAEIIIVDDGSSWKTKTFLEQLQSQYGHNWLKLVLLPANMGPGTARNVGWDFSTQPYIAFLDADDSWHPQKIEIQYTIMLENPDLVLTGHHWRYVPKKNLRSFPTHSFALRQKRVRVITAREALFKNVFCTSTVMIKRDTPFRFHSGKRYAEDYLLWLDVILSGLKAGFIDLELAYLHKRPYGEGGLSRDLWRMELGELETYYQLWRKSKVSTPLFALLTSWSLAKYFRRCVKLLLQV